MKSTFVIGILILFLCAGGCWREVEYTPPEPSASTEKQAPVAGDRVAATTDPAQTGPGTSTTADDSKAAAGEFGDDLAATLSAEEPAAATSEPKATTPIAESSPSPASVVGERYATTPPAETPPAEPSTVDSLFADEPAKSGEPSEAEKSAPAAAAPPANTTVDSLFGEPVDSNTPPDSPVNDSMLPEQREAIAEMSDTPIVNLNDDDIQTPPAVQDWNTRRAAWLLGSKLSLAALANEHGASAVDVQKLFGQSRALADKLGIEVQTLPARPAAGGAARSGGDPALDYLFNEGQEIGGELSKRQGADHAALFEVAVKSNILLVIYKPVAPTTEAIAAAIERAGERAKLPATLWQPLLDTLAAKGSLADVRAAVYRLHGETDKYLDQAPR